jgi:8-amino-7-oxononanoate synthase
MVRNYEILRSQFATLSFRFFVRWDKFGPAELCGDLFRFAKKGYMGQENFLSRKLEERKAQDALRRLRLPDGKADFCSNDYLGVVKNGMLAGVVGEAEAHGSGGSRLLAGNYALIETVEKTIADFHGAEAGLIFNSGYDANLGLLSCVPRRGDVVLYDALSHASIRDGMRLSFARAYAFAHNDLGDLERQLVAARAENHAVPGAGEAAKADDGANVFVVTESVFSMDGDQAPLAGMAELCRRFDARLIVDEAHGTGIIGEKGEGLVQATGLEASCFARIHTFGKAVGCHGAIVVGSALLREYLINFSRSFIYTTALPPASIRALDAAYALLPRLGAERERLGRLIDRFRAADIGFERLNSTTPIQVVVIPGNAAVRAVADQLQEAGLDVRPILSPTVERGRERLRIVLHAFNTDEEVDRLIEGLQKK